jgi:hypothetical protein
MAATATARTARASSAARRVAAERATARKPAPRRTAPAKRRRSRNTPITGFVPVAAVGGAVGGIADSGVFVWLTRGRLWIGLLGTLLVGIVALNVFALSFSASSSNAGQAADALRRSNSSLRAQIAGKLSNSEIQQTAARLGLTMPAAGSFSYVSTSPGDAKEAAKRLRSGELTNAATVAPVETAVVPVAPVTAPVDPATAPVDPAVAAPAVATTDPAGTTAPVAPAPDPAATTATAGAVGAP